MQQMTLPALLPPLPPLPPLAPPPVVHEFSPWYPMGHKPWEWGYYEIKCDDVVLPGHVLWDGQEWAWPKHFRRVPIAWRGRGHA